MRPFILAIALLCLGWVPAVAGAKDQPATAELIADVSAVQPGTSFHVGVRFAIQPGWHVYWMNPGDAGLPTTVQFHGPAGYKIEPLGDPTPTRFDQPGHIVGYGYTDSLLLIATVDVPRDAKVGSTVELTASAKWLVCQEVCLPGKAALSLKLPVVSPAQPSSPDNADLFKEWLARLPVPVAERAAVTQDRTGDDHVITLAWHEPVKNVQAFPAPGDGWVVTGMKIEGDSKKTVVRFSSRELDPAVKSVEMPLVIAYDPPAGQRQSVRLIVRLGDAQP
jgi:thiol:disulfide interchange protein DsbD